MELSFWMFFIVLYGMKGSEEEHKKDADCCRSWNMPS